MHDRQRIVAVFGANEGTCGDLAYEQARAVGRRLAELGCTVVNGGYGGTMAASARGAVEGGGRAIGVCCSLWTSPPNEYLAEVVRTESLLERLQTLLRLADGGFVVLPGATGTLVELATCWELMSKGQMQPRPLVCLGGFWRPVLELMRSAKPACGRFVQQIDGVEELSRYFGPPGQP